MGLQTYIALFRGINVGGKHRLPMADLVALLERLGLLDVRTYIQSGNVVFRSARRATSRLASQIGAAVKQRHGFEPQVLLLSREQLETAITSNPFPKAVSDPKCLHLCFLTALPERPDLQALERLCKKSERFRLQDAVFYLHAPDGIGRSKLAANVERLLGVPVTARNWRTVSKVMELARDRT